MLVQDGCYVCHYQHHYELCVAQLGGFRGGGTVADLWHDPKCPNGMPNNPLLDSMAWVC